jgi:hypothetical protein
MVHMPLFTRSGRSAPPRSALGRTVGTTVRSTRLLVRGTMASGRWVTRGVIRARARSAAGEAGMMRLFDLHAASCAGDTLIAIGLAGTIFFNVPLGEARSKVALYLLVTMVPFALLAPVVGPVLDHFRHGRRYALAVTMLGRAFLAWMISDYIHGFGLYPAAFGVLALSRSYGVARSAAVPRLLPDGIGLSQAGARASVYGTVAGALVAPLGVAAFWFGPQWPLRVASLIFLVGMVIALRLPPRADAEPPEAVPRPLRRAIRLRPDRDEGVLGRGGPGGRLVVAALIGSASLRALYGFLLLFLAFAIKAGDLATDVFGRHLHDEAALGLIGAALGLGTFLATATGTRLRIHQPAALQAGGLVVVAVLAVLTALWFTLPAVALLCLVTAIVSGLGKLAVDAVIQERIRERNRASAFAHSETVLMLAFVAGGGLGLTPVDGRIGLAGLAVLAVLAALRGVLVAGRLRTERLSGRAATDETDPSAGPAHAGPPAGAGPDRTGSAGTGPDRTGPAGTGPADPRTGSAGTPTGPVGTPTGPATPPGTGEPAHTAAPPGFHIYRPSSARDASGEAARRPSPEPRP